MGKNPQRVMECRVCGDGMQCGLGTATGRAATQRDPMRTAAVFSEPVLGFLPFGRCCVVPFLGRDFQRMNALAFRQSTGLRVDLRAEKRDPVIPGQAATTLGMLGGRLANGAPRGFVQRGTGCIASDGGHDGDLQKKAEATPAWGRNPSGWMKNTADAVSAITQVAVRPGGSTPAS